jgi:hypothetical protein
MGLFILKLSVRGTKLWDLSTANNEAHMNIKFFLYLFITEFILHFYLEISTSRDKRKPSIVRQALNPKLFCISFTGLLREIF